MLAARRLAALFTALVILLVLTGCRTPQRVLEPLPGPYVHAYPAAPPRESPQPPPTPATRTIRGATVVIDPGHGGKDPGAWPRNLSTLPEKTIVLDISSKLARMLSDRGGRTISTRTTDAFIELEARAAAADRHRADLFVSVHADSAPRASASGAGVHIYTQASLESQRAAQAIVAAFRRAGIETRGIYRNNFNVLREHSRPAVLIECGFLTNRGDAQALNDASYRTRLASAIADGVTDYLAR